MTNFVKLRKVDNWGYIYYVFSDAPDDSRAHAIPFPDGRVFQVTFPNGEIQSWAVLLKIESNSIGDMGHHYTVSSQVPYVSASFHGIPVLLPLEHFWFRRDEIQALLGGN